MPIRTLLVDDQKAIRSALRAYLRLAPDIDVVGEAVDGREAVALADQLEPHVVVMDLNLPELDGQEAARQITQHRPDTRVVFLSAQSEPGPRSPTPAAEPFVSRFVPKLKAFELLTDAIRAARLAG